MHACAQIREFLEKHYAETSGRETIKLAVKALMETVEAGSKSLEVGGAGAGIWPWELTPPACRGCRCLCLFNCIPCHEGTPG